MQRTLVLVGLLLSVLVNAGPARAESTYGTQVSTSCSVTATASPRHHARFVVTVRANAAAPVVGRVRLSLARPGSPVWRTSVAYRGRPVTIQGPRLRRGAYNAAVQFIPAPGVYVGSRCGSGFHAQSGITDAHGHVPTPAGGLPNTGGPSVWWLCLGAGLVAAGAAAVRGSPRRGSVIG